MPLRRLEQASRRELSCRCGDDNGVNRKVAKERKGDDHDDGIYHEATEVNGGNDGE